MRFFQLDGGLSDMSTEENDASKTPSEILASKVVNRLVSESLLTKGEADKLLPKIAEGSVETGDWKVAFEISLDREAANGS